MKIALVGGAGFIGHHLALRLKELGHDPLVVDHMSVNHMGAMLEKQASSEWGPRYVRMLCSNARCWSSFVTVM